MQYLNTNKSESSKGLNFKEGWRNGKSIRKLRNYSTMITKRFLSAMSFLPWPTLSLMNLLIFDGARREIMIGSFLPVVARLVSAARVYRGLDNGCLRMTSRMILAPSSIVSLGTWEPATGVVRARRNGSAIVGPHHSRYGSAYTYTRCWRNSASPRLAR